jgi:gliding motility-associated-like protein
MIRKLFTSTIILMCFLYQDAKAQIPNCGPEVPYELFDLRGDPTGTRESQVWERNGNCCTSHHPDNCLEFEIYMDTGAAMINFEIASGAIPQGSMYYQINCGPPVPVGHPICLVGQSPFFLTFCKPGTNSNTYRLTSIAKPTFPKDDTTRIGCSLPLVTLGMDESSITWQSVFPLPVGAYNSYLNYTSNHDTVIYTPGVGAPPDVQYEICGTPIATACGYVHVCHVLKIHNYPALTASVNSTPYPPSFCQGGPGILLTANASGGMPPYTYQWFDNNLSLMGTGQTYMATQGIVYRLRVKDALFDSKYCVLPDVNVPVIMVPSPTVNAGVDDTLCPTNPVVLLHGTVTAATGGHWSGGAGTFNPNRDSLIVQYTPTAGEILAGQVTFTLTSTGIGGGCTAATDAVTIHFPPVITISNLPPQSLLCNSSTTLLSPIIGGGFGSPPYGYVWNNNATTASITVGAGNYCLSITDGMGCHVSACTNVIVPPQLVVTMSSIDATTNGGNNGSATATPSGGNGPYTYSWNTLPVRTTQTITGLSYGVYCVTVTDANGCTVNSCVVVNEPRCLAFQVTTSATNILCNGNSTGSALAIVSGGTAPYSYSWNTIPVQTSASATGLSAGTYLVFVTESNGCVDVQSAVITQPTHISNTMNHTDVTVVGGNNGSATANPMGGTPSYSYLWSPGGGTTQTITNLTAGIYSVTITDSHGCTFIDYVQVANPSCAGIVMNTYVTNVSCPGGSNGGASAQILFGAPPYSYVWSTTATTPAITGLTAGTYTVVGVGAYNCSLFANVTVTQPSPLSISLVPTNIRCYSNLSHDGSIDVTASGGTYPYTFVWSNGMAVEDQVNLGPGSYTVTVTDAHGCTATASTTITEPPPFVITSTSIDVLCHGGNNGSINASISGGVVPYTYNWSNSATTQDLSGLPIGTYVLTVSDANNCIDSSLSVPINQPSTVTVDSIHVACPVPGSGVSQVTVYPNGGSNVTYQVSFNNGVTFLGPGVYTTTLPVGVTYQVVVHDNNGCTTTAPLALVIPPAVDIVSVSFNPCIADGITSIPVTLVTTGGSGGTLQASFDNGVTYLSPGVFTSNLATGASYNIILRDTTGCLSVTESITIPTEIILSGVMSSYGTYQVSCNGSTNGSIDLTASGGTGTYTYAWSNSSSTQDVSGLPAGTYSVVVTDGISCKDTINFTLTQPSALSSTLVSTNNFNGYQVSCNGSTNGAVNLTVSGGVTAYSYLWNTSATTEDISNLSAGTYSVLITDANGCTTIKSITLTQPTALTSSTIVTNVLCNGNATGAINLTVNGGVTVYTYNWSNSTTTEDLSGIGAGSYSVTITDANSCTTTASATITQPTLLTASGVVTNLTCFQSGNGGIDLSVSGGANSYTYLWNNSAVTQDLSGVAAGTYSVTITDANGCINTQSFIITEPALLTSSAFATSDFSGYEVSCNGSTNGVVDLVVTGGTAGYTYNWSNGATTQDITGIGAGTYSVTVTDSHGCTATSTVVLSQPAALTSSTIVTNVLCNGNATGAINLTVNGGVTAYTFNWSNSANVEDVSGLSAGSYSVIITDANACTTTASATITQPTLLTSSGTVSDLTCFQAMNGGIDLSVNGGNGSYTYLWSNSIGTQDLSDIAAGTYSVTVTDANGCIITQSFVVTEPPVLIATAIVTTDFNGYEVSCNGSANGLVNLTVVGGTAGYTFVWSNGSTTEDLSSIGAGMYNVTVTDANGCLETAAVTLTEPSALDIGASHVDVPCNGYLTGSIEILMNGGVQPYSYLWSTGETSDDLSNIGAGIYSVGVTDDNGCGIDTTVEISESMPIVLSNSLLNTMCNGDANGSIDLLPSGGTPPYNYLWSNGQTTQDLTNLIAGMYTVVVTDINNCTTHDTAYIVDPPILGSSVTSVIQTDGYNISLPGGNDGSIDLTVTGGTIPYQYLWSNGNTNQDINGLVAGTYSVIITDSHGCTSTVAITLDQPLVLEMPTGYSPNGDGSNDYFVVHGIDAYPNNKIEIFNRWGNLVYSADHYNNRWNGYNDSGEKLPDGTYFVILEINNGDIKLHGYVDLRR